MPPSMTGWYFSRHINGSDSFERLKEEASSKFKEYRSIYDNEQFAYKIDNMMTMACLPRDASGTLVSGSGTPMMPEQGWIDLLVYETFHNDTELRVAYPNTDQASASVTT